MPKNEPDSAVTPPAESASVDDLDRIAAIDPRGDVVAVEVPQADGAVTLAIAGEEPITFNVVDHIAQIPVDLAPRFAAAVDGSRIVEAAGLDLNQE